MYILIISRGYPDKRYKTYGIFERDQAMALKKQGHQIVFAAVDMRSLRRWRKWGIWRKEEDGLDIWSVNVPLGRIPAKWRAKISACSLKRLYKKIEKEYGKPDILHTFFTEQGYVVSKLKESTGIPMVLTEENSKINEAVTSEETVYFAEHAYREANQIIAVSRQLKESLKEKFKASSVYIPNLVDLDSFVYEEKPASSFFEFTLVGGLIPRKNIGMVIEAFMQCFSQNPRVRLTIFGEGPERERLETLIRKYGLEERVKLRGLCSRREIAQNLIKSDCFILASRTETFGVVYIEAMAMGVPVIATRCGGPETFVDDSNGILIDVDDFDGTVKAMEYMYENIGNYDREKIAQDAVEKFSPDAVAGRILKLYQRILGKDGKAEI